MNIKSLLDAIGEAEGARPDYWKGNLYDLTLGRLNLIRPISTQTIAEVKSTQKWMVDTLRKASGAVGKYQIINKTLIDLQKTMKFKNTDVFSAELQDRIAIKLLERRGLKKFLKGELHLYDFAKNLSKEWASLPNPETGVSYYGQRTHFSTKEMLKILEELL